MCKFETTSARGFKFINRLNFAFYVLCKFDAALGFEQKFKILYDCQAKDAFYLRKFKPANAAMQKCV